MQSDDRSSVPAFVGYREEQRASAHAVERFRIVRYNTSPLRKEWTRKTNGPLAVSDPGCTADTECQLSAALGHGVPDCDVGEALVRLAPKRVSEHVRHSF